MARFTLAMSLTLLIVDSRVGRLVAFGGWIIVALIGAGLELANFENRALALAFLGLASLWALGLVLFWVFARLRRPRIAFGTLIENDSRIHEGIRWAVRLWVLTQSRVGPVEAHLVAANSFSPLTAPLQLGWSNSPEAEIRLDGAVNRSVFLGFIDQLNGSVNFAYLPAAPGFPERHLHQSLRGMMGRGLLLVVRIVQTETGRTWDADLRIRVPRAGRLP